MTSTLDDLFTASEHYEYCDVLKQSLALASWKCGIERAEFPLSAFEIFCRSQRRRRGVRSTKTTRHLLRRRTSIWPKAKLHRSLGQRRESVWPKAFFHRSLGQRRESVWPKAFLHRSLGQRPSNAPGIKNNKPQSWPKAMITITLTSHIMRQRCHNHSRDYTCI